VLFAWCKNIAQNIAPSVGSRSDRDDNSLAETINGLYKAEVIHRRPPWKSRGAAELATQEVSGLIQPRTPDATAGVHLSRVSRGEPLLETQHEGPQGSLP